MKLTVIVTGRDDDYADDFLFRLEKSITSNIRMFKANNINFEYIVVDWFPLSAERHLYKCKLFEKIKDSTISHYIVDNSIAAPENLNKDIFYEYFAKNIGIKNSTGDYILLLNSDIIVPMELCKHIKHIMDNNLKGNFYRPIFRHNMRFIDDNTISVIEELPLICTANTDNIVLGAYSGDWLMVEKSVILDAGGYDETCQDHRNYNLWQTGMDAEILWNLHHRGTTLKELDTHYYHIKHGNSVGHIATGRRQLDGLYREGVNYTNKPDWGFVNYPKKKILSNVTMYTA